MGFSPPEWPHFLGTSANPGLRHVDMARLGLCVLRFQLFSISTGHVAFVQPLLPLWVSSVNRDQ